MPGTQSQLHTTVSRIASKAVKAPKQTLRQRLPRFRVVLVDPETRKSTPAPHLDATTIGRKLKRTLDEFHTLKGTTALLKGIPFDKNGRLKRAGSPLPRNGYEGHPYTVVELRGATMSCIWDADPYIDDDPQRPNTKAAIVYENPSTPIPGFWPRAPSYEKGEQQWEVPALHDMLEATGVLRAAQTHLHDPPTLLALVAPQAKRMGLQVTLREVQALCRSWEAQHNAGIQPFAGTWNAPARTLEHWAGNVSPASTTSTPPAHRRSSPAVNKHQWAVVRALRDLGWLYGRSFRKRIRRLPVLKRTDRAVYDIILDLWRPRLDHVAPLGSLPKFEAGHTARLRRLDLDALAIKLSLLNRISALTKSGTYQLTRTFLVDLLTSPRPTTELVKLVDFYASQSVDGRLASKLVQCKRPTDQIIEVARGMLVNGCTQPFVISDVLNSSLDFSVLKRVFADKPARRYRTRAELKSHLAELLATQHALNAELIIHELGRHTRGMPGGALAKLLQGHLPNANLGNPGRFRSALTQLLREGQLTEAQVVDDFLAEIVHSQLLGWNQATLERVRGGVTLSRLKEKLNLLMATRAWEQTTGIEIDPRTWNTILASPKPDRELLAIFNAADQRTGLRVLGAALASRRRGRNVITTLEGVAKLELGADPSSHILRNPQQHPRIDQLYVRVVALKENIRGAVYGRLLKRTATVADAVAIMLVCPDLHGQELARFLGDTLSPAALAELERVMATPTQAQDKTRRAFQRLPEARQQALSQALGE